MYYLNSAPLTQCVLIGDLGNAGVPKILLVSLRSWMTRSVVFPARATRPWHVVEISSSACIAFLAARDWRRLLFCWPCPVCSWHGCNKLICGVGLSIFIQSESGVLDKSICIFLSILTNSIIAPCYFVCFYYTISYVIINHQHYIFKGGLPLRFAASCTASLTLSNDCFQAISPGPSGVP